MGVNATPVKRVELVTHTQTGFNGHPPLGVNATTVYRSAWNYDRWGFNGHPPLGVNATVDGVLCHAPCASVSMGTHPWG